MAWEIPSLATLTDGVSRALGFTTTAPTEAPKGIATTSPQGPTFSVTAAMSAVVKFPWPRACVDAISSDLAGLPLRLTIGEGPTAEVVDSHPVLELLRKPTPSMDRVLWERQLWTYLLPVGWAPILVIGDGLPVALKLLHPERCRPFADTYGEYAGLQYQPQSGGMINYDAEAALLVRQPSWMAGDKEIVGEGLISALEAGLNSEHAAAKHAAKAANRGRPDMVITPADSDVTLTKPQREEVANEAAKWLTEGRPAFVMSGHLKAEFPGFTPRDLEFQAQRTLTREETLAVFGVPPTRVGLPTANYATAQAQDTIYWTSLKAWAALLDGVLTQIARRFDPRFTLTHDFSQVPALQESRDARLNRVMSWTMLGASGADAAAYEGFSDAPLTSATEPATPAADPNAPPAKGLAHLFVVRDAPTPIVHPDALVIPRDEAGRSAVWRGWLDSTHTPSEVVMARATRAALKAQADRLAGRLTSAPILVGQRSATVNRDIVADLVSHLFPPGEWGTFGEALREALRNTISAGFRSGSAQLGRAWRIDAGTADIVTDRRLGELIHNVTPTTQRAVAELIADGIAQGESVNDIAARLRSDAAFRPSRSLLIARTETTRSLTAGHVAAYRQYSDVEGVHVRKEWLSARDGEVRDAHAILDGQAREVGEAFIIEHGEYAGAKADGPGQFSHPALVCNCRCTTVPITEAA